jgi:hypothetical protein
MSATRKDALEIQHLSILAASILFINACSRLISIPTRGVLVTVLSIQWAIELDGRLLCMIFLVALVVSGSEAIFRGHPTLIAMRERGVRYSTFPHWVLPALAAFGGSGALNLLPAGPRWWFGLLLVSGLLVACISAEYYTIDRADYRHDPSAMALHILGLVILVIILSAIHFASARIALALPVIALTAAVICLRLLDLQSPRTRRIYWYAAGIGLIISELALPMEFLPISSVTFGLLLTLVAYDLLGIAQAALTVGLRRGTITEYVIVNIIAAISLLILSIV